MDKVQANGNTYNLLIQSISTAYDFLFFRTKQKIHESFRLTQIRLCTKHTHKQKTQKFTLDF